MDLETENRIAAILLKEAAELRRQAEKDGVHAYLCQPRVRGRPNSRFLTATVLGVQQANRAVEVNEMWRLRQKELELDDRSRRNIRDKTGSRGNKDVDESSQRTTKKCGGESDSGSSHSLKKRDTDDSFTGESEGLRDNEIEEFLHSRIKRGRGDVGSRMDETGPYLPSSSDSKGKQLAGLESCSREEGEFRVVLGPKKPSYLQSRESSDDDSYSDDDEKNEKKNRAHRHCSKKDRRRKESKSKDKKKKKRREKKKCKHHSS